MGSGLLAEAFAALAAWAALRSTREARVILMKVSNSSCTNQE